MANENKKMNNKITIVKLEKFLDETNSFHLQETFFVENVKDAFQTVFMCLLTRFHINCNSIRILTGQIIFSIGADNYRLVFVD